MFFDIHIFQNVFLGVLILALWSSHQWMWSFVVRSNLCLSEIPLTVFSTFCWCLCATVYPGLPVLYVILLWDDTEQQTHTQISSSSKHSQEQSLCLDQASLSISSAEMIKMSLVLENCRCTDQITVPSINVLKGWQCRTVVHFLSAEAFDLRASYCMHQRGWVWFRMSWPGMKDSKPSLPSPCVLLGMLQST